MGVTKQGLLAVLTNFREEGDIHPEARSRGAMVNAFLTQREGQYDSTADFVRHLVNDNEGLKGVGGFSLVCGRVGEPLAVISNRTPSVEGTTWILQGRGESIGLSNTAFADGSWTKVNRGKELLQSVIDEDVRHSKDYKQDDKCEEGLIEKCFELLSTDTLPKFTTENAGVESYIKEFRNSIFIPAIGGEDVSETRADQLAAGHTGHKAQDGTPAGDGMSGMYGTQKQSVVLVSNQGHVTFVERTLYSDDAKVTCGEERERWFEFDIEGWTG